MPAPPRVPVIVAINKMDKSRRRPDAGLHSSCHAARGVRRERWAARPLDVEVSAKTSSNLDWPLLETILLQVEVLDLKADPRRIAEEAAACAVFLDR